MTAEPTGSWGAQILCRPSPRGAKQMMSRPAASFTHQRWEVSVPCAPSFQAQKVELGASQTQPCPGDAYGPVEEANSDQESVVGP